MPQASEPYEQGWTFFWTRLADELGIDPSHRPFIRRITPLFHRVGRQVAGGNLLLPRHQAVVRNT
jgi:hypothetical protein